MRYHLASVRVGIIKKTTNRKCWQGCREKGTLMPIDGNVNYFTMENSMEIPQKIKNRTMYDPEIPLLGLIQRKQKHWFEKTYSQWHYLQSPREKDNLSVFTNGWMDEENVLYVYNGLLFHHKKNETLSFWQHGWTMRALGKVK